MPRHVHPDAGRVFACPECDSVPVYLRERDNTYRGDPDAPFVCYSCGETFDEPDERDAKNGGAGSKLEKILDGGGE